MRFYAVFDTNVLVSSMLTKKADSTTAMVVNAIADGVIIPIYSQAITEKYDEVLRRPKFPFSARSV